MSEKPRPVKTKGAGRGNRRLVMFLVLGAALLVGLVGFRMMAGGGSKADAPTAVAPAAAAPAAAVAKPAAAKPAAAPAVNGTRDPFHGLR